MKVKDLKSRLPKLAMILAPLLAIILELIPIRVLNIIRLRNSHGRSTSSIPFSQPVNTLNRKCNNIILMDSFAIPHWAIINTIAANELALEIGSDIATFSFSYQNKFESHLYKSLGIRNHVRIKTNVFNFFKVSSIYIRLTKLIFGGKKVIELELNEINIGLDVYESYLRRGHPTLDLKSRDLYRELWRGIKEYVYFKPLFSAKRIPAVFISHDNYVGPGLLARIAYKFEVPVILMNPFEVNVLQRPFQLYERFSKYRKYFDAQSVSWKFEHLERAKCELNRRITGDIGVGTMKYQIKSAFTQHSIDRQINPSSKKKLLILSHDFFDNPHGYSRMLFDDFIDWLIFVVECCKEENVDCYIKLHRDYSDKEFRIVSDFQRNFPNLLIVDPEVSYHQLYNEGIRVVTTCYGSAGHELPLLGFTVINASYNPHISYSFNHHAKSKSDYRRMLIEQEPIIINEALKGEIYEFYAVHTFLMFPDSFNMDSFEDFFGKCDSDFTGLLALKYLSVHFEEIKVNVSRNLLEALNTSRVFSVERSLPQDDQELFQDLPDDQVSEMFD